MSDDGNHVTLGKIYDLQLQTHDRLGSVEGRLTSIEANVGVMRASGVRVGAAVGKLQADGAATAALLTQHEARLNKISEEVGVTREVTGQIQLAAVETKHKSRWWALAKLGGLLALVAATVGAVVAVLTLWR